MPRQSAVHPNPSRDAIPIQGHTSPVPNQLSSLDPNRLSSPVPNLRPIPSRRRAILHARRMRELAPG